MKKKLTKKQEAIKDLTSKAGKATFKRHGKAHMSKIGKKGAKARWG